LGKTLSAAELLALTNTEAAVKIQEIWFSVSEWTAVFAEASKDELESDILEMLTMTVAGFMQIQAEFKAPPAKTSRAAFIKSFTEMMPCTAPDWILSAIESAKAEAPKEARSR
jgi:hypothetical protein